MQLIQASQSRKPRQINWALLIGAVIVALVLLAAIAGPTIAPRDPMQTNPVVEVGDRFWTPPFPVFTVPGFPLGSDQFGRDLFSRLLWSSRWRWCGCW
jgi:peptide/nickel transport system permease protein